jgi:hypothetical protein
MIQMAGKIITVNQQVGHCRKRYLHNVIIGRGTIDTFCFRSGCGCGCGWMGVFSLAGMTLSPTMVKAMMYLKFINPSRQALLID